MTLSSARASYEDCYTFFNAALEDPSGARMKVEDYTAGMYFRMRMNNARRIDRQDNMRIYKREDPKWGKSVYDKIIIRVKKIDDDFYVYAEQSQATAGEIEKLSEVDNGPGDSAENLESSAGSGDRRRV